MHPKRAAAVVRRKVSGTVKPPGQRTFDHLLNDLDQHIGQYWYRLGGTKQYEAIKQIAHTIQDITHDIEIGTKEGSYRTRAHGLETLRESLEYVQGLGGDIDRDADVKGYVVIGMEKILETTDVGELQRLKDKGWEEDLLLTIDDEDDELLDYFKADGASKPDEDEGTETETEEDRATKKRRRNE